MGWLLRSEEHSDLTLRVGEAEVRVSRLLLGCRSAYFRTILTAHFADARHVEASGVLDLSQTLPGLSRPSLLALLHFIYTGRVGGGAEGGGTGGDASGDAGGDAGGGAGGGASEVEQTVEQMEPQLALDLLPPASALLLDELKSLCEAVLVNYLDGENCEAIASVAEGCFASRLLTACRAISEGPGSC